MAPSTANGRAGKANRAQPIDCHPLLVPGNTLPGRPDDRVRGKVWGEGIRYGKDRGAWLYLNPDIKIGFLLLALGIHPFPLARRCHHLPRCHQFSRALRLNQPVSQLARHPLGDPPVERVTVEWNRCQPGEFIHEPACLDPGPCRDFWDLLVDERKSRFTFRAHGPFQACPQRGLPRIIIFPSRFQHSGDRRGERALSFPGPVPH